MNHISYFLFKTPVCIVCLRHRIWLKDWCSLQHSLCGNYVIDIPFIVFHQGPYNRRPVVKRVLVVTPSSLTANWMKEFKKWLGNERLGVFVVDQQNKVEHFASQQHTPVMIISYEMFVRSSQVIEKLGFDLLVCDEAHRLKNPGIKTTHLLASLPCKRRVLMTGTPVQNDLQVGRIFFSLF